MQKNNYMGSKDFTISDLANDAERAIKNGSPFSALALTFACISACANIEYPDIWFNQNGDTDEYMKSHFPEHYKNGKYNPNHSHDKERFVMWVDDWKNAHNCENDIKAKMEHFSTNIAEARKTDYGILPRLDGDILYQIRCSLLHEGSNDIDFSNKNKIKDEGNRKIQDFAFILGAHGSMSSTDCLYVSVDQIVDVYISCVCNYLKKHQDKIKQFKVIKGISIFDSLQSLIIRKIRRI